MGRAVSEGSPLFAGRHHHTPRPTARGANRPISTRLLNNLTPRRRPVNGQATQASDRPESLCFVNQNGKAAKAWWRLTLHMTMPHSTSLEILQILFKFRPAKVIQDFLCTNTNALIQHLRRWRPLTVGLMRSCHEL